MGITELETGVTEVENMILNPSGKASRRLA